MSKLSEEMDEAEIKAETEPQPIMTHDQAWHEERRKGIGGSDAGAIMAGEWLPLWEVKTGRKKDENLDWVLPVQMGIITEDLNRRWFAHEEGPHVSTENCESLTHPKYGFMRCNLDGRVGDALFEAKHVNAFSKPEEVVARYYWQLQHCLAVAGADLIHLSVFFGTLKWECFEVARDEDAIAQLIERERAFWNYVEGDEPPPDSSAGAAPEISFDSMREVSMEGNNAWASSAADWTENQDAVKTFKAAEKELKELVEPDVKQASGHGIEIKRAKNGALTIREAK